MNDLISRTAAIDAISHHGEIENDYTDLYHDGYCDGVYDAVDVLKDLPSAEPEIVRCRDCKHHDGIRCFRWNSTIITGFDDYCSNAERRGEEE